MIIAIDGACRKPGTPECFAVGAYVAKDKAVIRYMGMMLYVSHSLLDSVVKY